MRFGDALLELLQEEDVYVTSTGKVNLSAFARELDGIHYQSLRRAVSGARPVPIEMIEECARALRVRPNYFLEYRILRPRHLGAARVA
jgi:hypothetical protein